MEIKFDGKKALVTGAGKGIGRETVKALAKCGARVVALCRTQSDLESLKTEVPDGLETVCVDIRDWEATRKAVSELEDIDFLVNNAGCFFTAPFLDVTKEQIDQTFDLCIKGVFNITQVVAQALVNRGVGGVIVNISSTISERVFRATSVYSSAKGAVDMLTKALSVDLGEHKIRVAGVQPTITKTPELEVFLSSLNDGHLSKHTLGRFCEMEDVVNAILFVLSDKASMIHGSNITVDGGYLAW